MTFCMLALQASDRLRRMYLQDHLSDNQTDSSDFNLPVSNFQLLSYKLSSSIRNSFKTAPKLRLRHNPVPPPQSTCRIFPACRCLRHNPADVQAAREIQPEANNEKYASCKLHTR